MPLRFARPGERTRKFVREVGSVVLGVLIALGIGEVADSVRWHLRARASLSAMHDQLSGFRVFLDERKLIQPCAERRWAELDQILREARRTGRLPDIGKIGTIPVRPGQDSAWQAALSEGVTLHLPREQVARLSLAYSGMITYRDGSIEEQRDAVILAAAEHAPGPVASDLLSELTVTLQTLSQRSYLDSSIASVIEKRLDSLGFVSRYSAGNIATSPEDLRTQVANRTICQALMVDGRAFAMP